MIAYCLFCETRRCGEIAKAIEDKYGYRCISPKILQRKWVQGVPQEVWHDWLPGYLFLYTEAPVERRLIIKGILRRLGEGPLEGRDHDFAMTLYQRGGVMGTVHLSQVGDRCTIHDPAWKGIAGTLLKLDRNRKRCCVEFEFDGVKRSVWVGYEMLEPDESLSMESPK